MKRKENNMPEYTEREKSLISEAVNIIFRYLDVMTTNHEITVYGNEWCLERYTKEVAVAKVSKERMKSEIMNLFKPVNIQR